MWRPDPLVALGQLLLESSQFLLLLLTDVRPLSLFDHLGVNAHLLAALVQGLNLFLFDLFLELLFLLVALAEFGLEFGCVVITLAKVAVILLTFDPELISLETLPLHVLLLKFIDVLLSHRFVKVSQL